MQKIWAEQSEPLNTIKRKQSVKKIREPLAEGKLEIVDNVWHSTKFSRVPSKIWGKPLIFRAEVRVFFSHMAEKNGENLGERSATSEPLNARYLPRAERECNVVSAGEVSNLPDF